MPEVGREPRNGARERLVLVAQQALSHGESLILAYREGRSDAHSLVVLLFLPVVVVVAVRLARRLTAPCASASIPGS